jgi:hypothetical protein
VRAAGRCAAQTGKEAASPPLTPAMLQRSRPGDAPRKDTGPPLSVKAGCDPRVTANREAAWHTDTRSPALSAEPPAAPGGRKSGQAPACPHPGRGASGALCTRPPVNARSMKNELAFDSQKKERTTRIHYP